MKFLIDLSEDYMMGVTIIPRNLAHLNKTLRPGPIWLKSRRGSEPPERSPNFIRSIINFARFMGLNFIPAKTVEKLRTDPYFKYCFADLITNHSTIYDGSAQDRENITPPNGLVALLKNSDLATDKDIYLGIFSYINNFMFNMPGGSMRIFCEKLFKTDPELFREKYREQQRKETAIDAVLTEKGLMEKAGILCEDFQSNRIKTPEKEVYSRYLEFMKLCLDVFNILMDRYRFSWKELFA